MAEHADKATDPNSGRLTPDSIGIELQAQPGLADSDVQRPGGAGLPPLAVLSLSPSRLRSPLASPSDLAPANGARSPIMALAPSSAPLNMAQCWSPGPGGVAVREVIPVASAPRFRIVYENGTVYVGQCSDDGQLNGFGTATTASGVVYQGEWRANKKHGQGTRTSADGSVYQGGWVQNARHGLGVMTDAHGHVVHAGLWLDDEFVGNSNSNNQIVLGGAAAARSPLPAPASVSMSPGPGLSGELAKMQGAANGCAAGHVLSTEFTLGGIICCVLLFPIGIFCCCVMRQHRCERCGMVFEN